MSISWSLLCSLNGRAAPCEPLRRKDSVDEEGKRRQGDQCNVECRSHLHEESEIVSEQSDREREHEAAEPRVGRGARIGDHEEGEDQQRTALQLMQRDRWRIAEPDGTSEQQSGMDAEEK